MIVVWRFSVVFVLFVDLKSVLEFVLFVVRKSVLVFVLFVVRKSVLVFVLFIVRKFLNMKRGSRTNKQNLL